jgi:cytochrome c553
MGIGAVLTGVRLRSRSSGGVAIAPRVRLDSGVSAPASAVQAVPAPAQRGWRWVLVPVVVFALVSLTVGILARHDPRSTGYFRLFFEDPIHLKAGFATAAVVLACFQLLTAAWIFRKLPWSKPAWVNPAHRWSGRLAFVCTLPVAYHCIFKLGFRSPTNRVLVHSLLGCAVYGAFAAKVTIVRLHRFPRLVLPIAGGLLFAILVGVWYTSAVWLYRRTAPGPAAYAGINTVPANADAAAGKAVFTSAGCGSCHVLKVARANGQIGPNLDSLQPTYDRVLAQVQHGGGGMPAFDKQLSAQQIRDVAAFVSTNAGSG